MTRKLNNARNSTVINDKINQIFKNAHALSTQAVYHGHPE